jgi:hypothetical protein
VTSTPVTAGSVISAANWTRLRNDLAKCYTHITNSPVLNGLASTNTNPPYLQVVTSGSTILNATLSAQYLAFATYLDANKLTVSSAQVTPNIPLTSTIRTAAWGGATDSVAHTVTLTFAGYTPTGGTAVSAADHARVFFNAGGSIQIRPTLRGYSGSKGTDWYNMLAGIGTLNFRGSAVDISGTRINSPGSVNSDNNFNSLTIGGTAKTILTQASGTSMYYVENRYIVQVSRPTSVTLLFTVTFQDNDAGDQKNIGPGVDEEVTGTLTSAVLCTRPSTANIDVPAPSGTTTIL